MSTCFRALFANAADKAPADDRKRDTREAEREPQVVLRVEHEGGEQGHEEGREGGAVLAHDVRHDRSVASKRLMCVSFVALCTTAAAARFTR